MRFLTLSMRIIKTDLYSPLKHVYGLQLQNQIMLRFQEMLQEKKELLTEFIDFWTVAVEKQPRLVEEMFKATDSDLFCSYLQRQKDLSEQNKTLKLAVLVCLMAIKKCCLDTVEHKSH